MKIQQVLVPLRERWFLLFRALDDLRNRFCFHEWIILPDYRDTPQRGGTTHERQHETSMMIYRVHGPTLPGSVSQNGSLLSGPLKRHSRIQISHVSTLFRVRFIVVEHLA